MKNKIKTFENNKFNKIVLSCENKDTLELIARQRALEKNRLFFTTLRKNKLKFFTQRFFHVLLPSLSAFQLNKIVNKIDLDTKIVNLNIDTILFPEIGKNKQNCQIHLNFDIKNETK
jgi:hypothetical protein